MEKISPNTDPILVTFPGYRDVDEFREKSEASLIVSIKTTIEAFCTQTAEQIPTCSLIFREKSLWKRATPQTAFCSMQ